jgi:glycosyltransferase involved in cell wall biosynthesis
MPRMGARLPALFANVDAITAARQPMRVAVVSETYPPEVNGVALTLQRMLEGLRARHHHIQLVRLRQHADDLAQHGPGFEELLLRGVAIPRYPHLKMGLPCTSTLLRAWTSQRPDVVHIATEGPLGWSALRAAMRLSLPVVSDFRTNFHAYSRHYGLGWLRRGIVGYLRAFHNRTACTMVPTPAARHELATLGFANLQVVARGVDTARFDPAKRNNVLRRLWGATPDTLVVLCVSRLATEKNIVQVWQAFEAIQRLGIDARLVLVGDGPLKPQLEQLCEGAVFAGVRRGDDLAAHYASADLFLFPSLTETFGNVVPEAMASGLPVVAYDCAAAGQLIRHTDNGLLAAPERAADFIDLAVQAARDAAALPSMGARARARVLPLDWRRVVDDLEMVLLQAVLRDAINQSPLLLRPLSI